MFTVFSNSPKTTLFILIGMVCVTIVSFQSWLPTSLTMKKPAQYEKHEKDLSNDQFSKDVFKIIYRSFKPERCLVKTMKPQCLGPNPEYLHGLNQSRDINKACFPEEVVFNDIVKEDPNFPQKDQILALEKETMNDPEFIDMFNTASLEQSRIILEQPNRNYQVGDVIRVQVDMFNTSGKPRTVGGDDVRALMMSNDSVFSSGGQVFDFKNGSYQVTFQALQKGSHIILITVPYTREMRATVFKWFRRHKTFGYYFGVFAKFGFQEFTVCSPFSTILGHNEVCNMTAMNDGLPWFCGRPLNGALNCNNFVKCERLDYAGILANFAQYTAFSGRNLNKTLKWNKNLYISNGNKSSQLNKRNCNEIKPRDTWNTTMPTGYVYNKQWIQMNCTNTVTKRTALRCLHNTTFFITGDSTTHHWYIGIKKLTNCTLGVLKWSNSTWSDNGICINKELNITVRWAPHPLPFIRAKKNPDGFMNLKSVSTHLREIPSFGRVIVLIHIYAHLTRQHYSLFWIHIRSLKPAIRDALQRNKDLKLAIKSPHMFYRSPCLPMLNDLQGPIFIDILHKEFDEFKDSVIYLNYWEMNHALLNDVIHPRFPILWENIRHFLGYVC